MMLIAVFLISTVFTATPTIATKQTREYARGRADLWADGTANARKRAYPEGTPQLKTRNGTYM